VGQALNTDRRVSASGDLGRLAYLFIDQAGDAMPL
jgi:hypothetical protein